MINVKDLGALGDGISDDGIYIQKALDIGGEVFIPSGDYRVKRTLRIGSNTAVYAGNNARIFSCEQVPKRRGDFLITNSDFENGNESISISGGIWDGNFDRRNNTKPKDRYSADGWSGATMNFYNVKGLKLLNMKLTNSVVYNTRFCKIENFEIKNIEFSAKQKSFNQDGLHFNGWCKNGTVENISAEEGQTNDDLIALNADDVFCMVENRDLCGGNIENITFKNVYAADCHTGIRLLSVKYPIRNIKFDNVCVGVREFALNIDAARYCMNPIFKEEDYPRGCGMIENVLIENFTVYMTDAKRKFPLIDIETRMKNFEIRNFKRLRDRENLNDRKTLEIKNLVNTEVLTDDKVFKFKTKQDKILTSDEFSYLKI